MENALKALKWLIGFTCITTASTFADIVSDPSVAGHRDQVVLETANGTQQVNIRTPNSKGLSHNTYSQFDVDSQGVILNNSKTDILTQQAGMVSGNPNLTNGTASVILNEVNSMDPSQLNGFIEVAGDRANVIVANPSGIRCSGCGFINTHQSTLTTGKPEIAQGNLLGYRVTRGHIEIRRGGLNDQGTDYTQIIARSVAVNADIQAKNLQITTGPNFVSTDHKTITPLNGEDNETPQFSIDVALLGGMYADHIRLIGTEDGVGVRNAGQIGAGVGEFILTADGQLVNTGRLIAENNMTLNSNGVDNSGVIHSQQQVMMESTEDVANSGTIDATQQLTLNVEGQLNNSKRISSDANILLNTNDLTNSGSLLASENLEINTQTLTQTIDGEMGAGLTTLGNIREDEDHSLSINVSGTALLSGTQLSSGDINIQAQNIGLNDLQQQADAIDFNVAETLSGKAIVQTAQNIELNANNIELEQLDALATQFESTAGDVAITDSIIASDTLMLTANENNLTLKDSQLEGIQSVNLTAAQTLKNDSSIIQSDSDIQLQSGTLDNLNGQIITTENININTTDLNNAEGLIQATQDLNIQASGKVTNSQSGDTNGLVAGNDLTLSADSLDNRTGYLTAANDITLTVTENIQNDEGNIVGIINTKVTAESFENNQGSLQSGNDLTLNVSALNNNNGEIIANTNIDLQSNDIENQNGKLIANNNIIVNAADVNNTQGLIQANQDLNLQTTGAITNTQSGDTKGLIAGNDLTLSGNALDNSTGYLAAGRDVTLSVTQNIDNQKGNIVSVQNSDITADTLNNNQGGVQSNKDLALNVNTLNNEDGFIQALEEMTVNSIHVNNLNTNNSLKGIEAQILSLNAATFNNDNGKVVGDDLNLTLNNTLTNQNGLISATKLLQLSAANNGKLNEVNNYQGRLVAGNTLQVNSQNLLGQGTIESAGSATVSLEGDYTHENNFLANDDFTLTITGDFTNSENATLIANDQLNINAVNIQNQLNAELEGTDVYLNADDAVNNQGLINSNGVTKIEAKTLNNNSTGRIYGDDVNLHVETLNNIGDGNNAPVIASRNNMQLGVKHLNNENEALILSENNLTINGTFERGNGIANAESVRNVSANIEAANDVSIAADVIENLNGFDDQLPLVAEDTEVKDVRYYSKRPGPAPLVEIDGEKITREIRGGDWWVILEDGREIENEYFYYEVERTTTHSTPVNIREGVITAGGNIHLSGDNIINQDSKIIAGLDLTSTSDPELIETTGAIEVSIKGDMIEHWGDNTHTSGRFQRTQRFTDGVDQILESRPVKIDALSFEDHTTLTRQQSGASAARTAETINTINRTDSSATAIALTAPSDLPTIETRTVNIDSQTTIRDPIIREQIHNTEIRTVKTNPLTNSSLFEVSPANTNTVLIETDPRFIDPSQWLSSDYMLQQLTSPTDILHQRLGDGYYEQRLVREQLMSLTGQRLRSYENEQVQFQALMDAGIAFAEEYQLSAGIALSAEQMQALTSDIIWLETETVTLADGSQHDVLVPRVYAVVQNGDIDGQGSILSGRNVNLDGDSLVNRGTIAAREGIRIQKRTIDDFQGRLQGNTISVAATEDITLNSSQWQAKERLSIDAKRDLTIQRATHNFSGTHSQTLAGDATRLSVTGTNGEIQLTSRRDLTLTGSTIENQGSGTTALTSGRDLAINTTKTSETASGNAGYYEKTQHLGSSIDTQGDLTLNANNDLTISGSTIDSAQDMTLQGQSVALSTAVNKDDYEYQWGENHHQQNKSTHVLTELNGKNVQINSDSELTLTGTNIQATDNIDLNAEGDILITAAQDELYQYRKDTEDGSFGSSTTTITESFTTNNVGGQLQSGSQISIDSNDGDITLLGAGATSGNEITLSGNNVLVGDLKEVDYYRHETHKTGFAGLSSKSSGRINREEILQASQVIAEEQDLNIFADQDIIVLGSELKSGGNLNLEAVGDILVAAENVLETSQTWSSETDFLGDIDTLYERQDSLQSSTTSTAIASTLDAGNNININASRATVVGSDLIAGDSINATTDVGDIQILSADQTQTTHSKETQVKVGVSEIGKQLQDIDELIKPMGDIEDGQLKFEIAKAQYDQQESNSQTTDNRASTLTANNNITLDAAGDINIKGADIIADQDANQSGDINLTAGGDISIAETQQVTDTQTQTTHGAAELSLVVQHQAVEVAKAARAVENSKDQLKQANEDYRQYRKEVKQLKAQRETLQAQLGNNEVGISQQDILNLNALIEEIESDEEWYQAGIALAATDLASKTTLLVQQTAAAAQSTGSLGFNVGVQLDIEATKTDQQSHTETSRGSLLSGNNINIQTGNNSDIDATQTLIRGSELQATDAININTGDLNILASQDESYQQTDSESVSGSVSQTVYGTSSGGPTFNTGVNQSRSKNRNITHTNSTLSSKNINLNSTQDTNLTAANVHASEVLDVTVGGDLTVASVQDRYSSDNKSKGINGGIGLDKDSGHVSSVSGGANTAKGRSFSTETVLTSLTGGEVNIDVEGKTTQTGSVIAAVDSEGNDNGQLNLDTQSYEYVDLTDSQYSSSQSVGVSTNVGISNGQGPLPSQAQQNQTDEQGNPLRLNTSTVNIANEMSAEQSKTLATLGDGNVTIRDDNENGTDSTQGLNRDLSNTNKELYSVEHSQSVEATIDHNMKENAQAGIELASKIKESISNRIEALGDDLSPDMRESLDKSGEQAIDSLIKEGLSSEEANQFLQDYPQIIDTIVDIQILRNDIEGNAASYEENQSSVNSERAASETESEMYTIQMRPIVVTGDNQQSILESGVMTLGQGQRYLDELYETNPRAAQLAGIAIHAATGGPVKAVISEGINQTVTAVVGEQIEGTVDAITAFGGTQITSQKETIDEFIEAAQNQDSDEALIQDGARFAVDNFLGIGAGKGGNKGPKNQIEVDRKRSGSGGPEGNVLKADEIRFSQNTVSYNKKNRITGEKYTYDDLVTSMKKDGWKGDPVDVVKMPDGKITSMDNTRIRAAREASIDVQANVRNFNDPLTPEMKKARGWEKYNTWGEAITGRIKKQSGGFSDQNPSGSLSDPKLTGKKK